MRKLFILLLTLVSLVGNGQHIHKTKTFSTVEQYLSKIDKAGFSGSILVEVKGMKIYSKGHGFSNQSKRVKNTSNTLFDIGSLTKQFTAAAILKLEMQKKLTVNDKISKYFPGLLEDKADITIHDLLRHQSGLISNVGSDYEKITQQDFLNKVFASKLKFKMETSFSYSNIGYSLLGMIIEKVSGQSYESYLYDNLWRPSKMEYTGYKRPAFDTNAIAVGYYQDNKIWGRPEKKGWDSLAPFWHLKGNGGILSTVEDLYKWHKMLQTDKILSKEAINKLFYPAIRPEESKNAYYAYGWDVSLTSRNTVQIWHNGTNHIFYADFLRLIDDDIAIIMLSNKSHPNFDHISFEIAKIITNKDYSPEMPIVDNEVNRKFTYKILKALESKGSEAAADIYKRKKSTENILEFIMRNEGFNKIDNKFNDLALKIFRFNVDVHPYSAKALQGLGEGYMETGNKELAIQFFEKSLKIDSENTFVINMLKELKK